MLMLSASLRAADCPACSGSAKQACDAYPTGKPMFTTFADETGETR